MKLLHSAAVWSVDALVLEHHSKDAVGAKKTMRPAASAITVVSSAVASEGEDCRNQFVTASQVKADTRTSDINASTKQATKLMISSSRIRTEMQGDSTHRKHIHTKQPTSAMEALCALALHAEQYERIHSIHSIRDSIKNNKQQPQQRHEQYLQTQNQLLKPLNAPQDVQKCLLPPRQVFHVKNLQPFRRQTSTAIRQTIEPTIDRMIFSSGALPPVDQIQKANRVESIPVVSMPRSNPLKGVCRKRHDHPMDVEPERANGFAKRVATDQRPAQIVNKPESCRSGYTAKTSRPNQERDGTWRSELPPNDRINMRKRLVNAFHRQISADATTKEESYDKLLSIACAFHEEILHVQSRSRQLYFEQATEMASHIAHGSL